MDATVLPPPPPLHLEDPTVHRGASFMTLIDEMRRAGEELPNGTHELQIETLSAYIDRLRRMREGTVASRSGVRTSTWWLLDRHGTVVGGTQLRHELTPDLREYGGHIGFSIRPSLRRRGYGTLALALVLEKARSSGLYRVLLTCDADNLGSRQIIERNGGVVEDEQMSPHSRSPVRRYWIHFRSRN